MKPSQARKPLRLKAMLFALSVAAMSTQVGGASSAAGVAGSAPVAQMSAAMPLLGERELLTWLASLLRAPPESGRWALVVAGLVGVCAIGLRRISASGSRSLDPYRLRHR